MSRTDIDAMAIGRRIQGALTELFAQLNSRESTSNVSFKTLITSLQKNMIRRFQVDYASLVTTCYVNDKMTLEFDVPRHEGGSSDTFDESKIAAASRIWVTGVEGRADSATDGKYPDFAKALDGAGVCNILVYLPETGQNSGKIIYIGKKGGVYAETFKA